MKKGRGWVRLSVLLAFGLGLVLACNNIYDFSGDSKAADLKKTLELQNLHTPELMSHPDVLGTATGLTDTGAPAIVVYTQSDIAPGSKAPVIPRSIEGVPVLVKSTAGFFALENLAGKEPKKGPPPGKGGGNGDNIDPTARFNLPVPIGVSVGNEEECSSGTIGARLRIGGGVFALSNNHVFALSNEASAGSEILQPGLYDTGCVYDDNNVIGTLQDFVTIDFAGGTNTVDAAITGTSIERVGNTTPSDGYGTPKETVVEAFLDQEVQKYGRSTALTNGTVTGINATLRVRYSAGVALFIDQIIVESGKPFIKNGDSGSLVVDLENFSVGLVFAGNTSGKLAVANPIQAVLDAFGVDATIDGT
jgi:hypothetical protein